MNKRTNAYFHIDDRFVFETCKIMFWGGGVVSEA